MIWAILGIPFSVAIIATWYFETYTDSTYGQRSRFVGSAMHKSSKSNSIGFPATGLVFFIASIAIICDHLKFHYSVQLTLSTIALVTIIIALIWRFSPLPLPRWADARYQYMKRHNLLDENGDPLPQFEVSEDAEESATNDQNEDTL